MPASVSATPRGRPLCRVPWNPLACTGLGSRCLARASAAQSTLGHPGLCPSELQPSHQGTFYRESPGITSPMPLLALAVLPGRPLCKAPQDLPACVLAQFQPALQSNLCAESKNTLVYIHFCISYLAKVPSLCRALGSPQLAPTLLSAIPVGHLCTESSRTSSPTHHISSSHPTKAPLAEHHGTLWLVPISASTILLECPQGIDPLDTAACIHFSFSCPDRAPATWNPRAPSPCQPQLQPASKSHQAHTVDIGDDQT